MSEQEVGPRLRRDLLYFSPLVAGGFSPVYLIMKSFHLPKIRVKGFNKMEKYL